VLSAARSPQSTQQLWKQVQSDLDRVEDLNKLLAGLVQGGKIQYVPRSPKSSIEGYLIVRSQLKNDKMYVDYDLLLESKI
jgi:hypothetical protein